jgi:NAD(P)-dependent dehydrogenase (short-subunit alcohol dehydrogenase family)
VIIEGMSAIVTGDASGLGRAAATALAERGARVALFDRHESGRRVAAEIGAIFVAGDVADAVQVGAAVEAALDMAPLGALVNCAGVARGARVVDRDGNPFDLAVFEFVLRVNLIGTFNCLRLAAAAMARTAPNEGGERGAIVNTASVAGFEGQIGQAAYAASKAGISGMTLPIARDLASSGIRVNTIAPGLFETPIYGDGENAEAYKAHLAKSVAFPRRLGRGEEFASLVLECLTNPYMNGEVLRLDGGCAFHLDEPTDRVVPSRHRKRRVYGSNNGKGGLRCLVR